VLDYRLTETQALAASAPSDKGKRAIARAAMHAKRTQEEVRQSENRLRLVIGTIPTMAWSLLPDGAVDFVNQRWLEYTGLSLEEALADANRTVHPDDLPRVMEKWRADMAVGEQCEYEMRLRRADGEYRWFLVRTVPLRNEQGNIDKWYGTSTDIHERKIAENALRRLVELQESERKDLVRELHERVDPILTSLSINLKLIKDALPPALRHALAHTLADSRAQLRAATMALRDVMGNLRPHDLDQHGLQPAPYDGEAADVEIALFRIAQEALDNVAKHARAKSVVITLERHGSEYVMSVVDDEMGLRASDAHGDGPRPGAGTRLMVRVPK
jgi:PAS domain S-box-containing protein